MIEMLFILESHNYIEFLAYVKKCLFDFDEFLFVFR